jgi:hypothetical protein
MIRRSTSFVSVVVLADGDPNDLPEFVAHTIFTLDSSSTTARAAAWRPPAMRCSTATSASA